MFVKFFVINDNSAVHEARTHSGLWNLIKYFISRLDQQHYIFWTMNPNIEVESLVEKSRWAIYYLWVMIFNVQLLSFRFSHAMNVYINIIHILYFFWDLWFHNLSKGLMYLFLRHCVHVKLIVYKCDIFSFYQYVIFYY